MNIDSITSAFDMLLDELEQVIPDLNNQIIELTSQKEFNKAQTILDKAKRVSSFQQKVQALSDEWAKIEGRSSGKETGLLDDIEDVGRRTPSEFFHIPLLQALADFGGRAHCQRVIARVGQTVGSELSDFDWQTLSDGKTVRWENTVHWARNDLVKSGLLMPVVKRSYWELNSEGWAALEETKKKE